MRNSSQRGRVRRHLRVIEGRPPTPRRKGAAWKWLLSGAGIGLFILAIFLGLGRMKHTEVDLFTLTAGTLEVTHEAKALVIRRESVHTSPVSGELRPLVSEGSRVRVGAPVAEIGPASARTGEEASPPGNGPAVSGERGGSRLTDALMEELRDLARALYRAAEQMQQAASKEDWVTVSRLQQEMERLGGREQELAARITALEQGQTPYAPAAPPVSLPEADTEAADGTVLHAEAAGIVVYHVDGLEEIGAAIDLLPSLLEGLQTARRSTEAGAVAVGQPVFKVIDNATLQIAVVLPSETAAPLREGGEVEVRLQDYENRLLRARIEQIVVERERTLLVLAPGSFPDELLTVRRPSVRLVLSRYTGLIAPVSAVDWSGPKPGIYVREGRNTKLYPIRVIAHNESHVAFAADLEEGAQVLTNAAGAR